jgi:hypothetical protein
MQDQEALVIKTTEAIRHIGTCADRLPALTEFLDNLRHDPQWSEADIATVRSRVSLLLKEFKAGEV